MLSDCAAHYPLNSVPDFFTALTASVRLGMAGSSGAFYDIALTAAEASFKSGSRWVAPLAACLFCAATHPVLTHSIVIACLLRDWVNSDPWSPLAWAEAFQDGVTAIMR